jgi:predicted AlkP superfamily pyrophosphatase or phosphodiesterase
LSVDRGPYTVSTPGWSTILHGVWPDKHGLTENSFRKNRYDTYPDIFTLMRRTKPELGLASLSNWDAFLQITSEETYAQRFDTDPEMTQEAISLIQQCTPDVMLLHFDYPDATGHEFGFNPSSPEYLSSIEITDHYLGEIMSHIYQREAQFNEEWMVVLTTDHGGNGTGHGGQDNLNETRYVWYVVRSPSFTNSLINNGESVDLLPTMMKWLEVSTNGMSLDGTAIY